MVDRKEGLLNWNYFVGIGKPAEFLSNLLKDKAYVEMAYMTGILPIANFRTMCGTQESVDSFVDASGESLRAVFPADASYSSGSELNMFFEFSMATKVKYSQYLGFTDEEVDVLYQTYWGKYGRSERRCSSHGGRYSRAG